MTSDLFAVWYSGLCSKFYLIHSSFSGNPADPQKAHIHLKPTAALQKLSKLNEKTQSVRFRIEKNGQKIELRSLKRVKTNCSLSVSDRTCTSDWSVQSETLSLLSRFLFVNPEKKISAVTMPTDFFVFECIPIMAQHRKNCPKNLNSYGVNCKENAYGKIKPPQPKHTWLSNASQKFDHVRMWFQLFHCFKFFPQTSSVGLARS